MTFSMTTDRTFGIELECIGLTAREAASTLSNAGIDVKYAGYTHQTTSYWKVVTDISILDSRGMSHRSGGKTFEVVSPVLKGIEGLQAIKQVCDTLKAAGATVNKTCGMHVHVGAKDLTVEEMKNIYVRYSKFKAEIDNFMPLSRRNSQWAAKGTISSAVRAAKTKVTLANVTSTRYVALNLKAYLKHSTVEYRQHSGTVEAKKAINWVLFCLSFAEASKTKTGGKIAKKPVRVSGKKAVIKAFVEEHLGMTRKELVSELKPILAAQGMSTDHLSTHVRNFKAWALGEEVTLSRTSNGSDSLFRGVPSQIVAFYNERAAHFAQ